MTWVSENSLNSISLKTTSIIFFSDKNFFKKFSKDLLSWILFSIKLFWTAFQNESRMQVLAHIDKAKDKCNKANYCCWTVRVSIMILLFLHGTKEREVSSLCLHFNCWLYFHACACVCCHFHIFNGLSKLFTLKGINHLMIIMFEHEKMRPQYFYHSFFSPCYIARLSPPSHMVLTRLSLATIWKAYATYFTHLLEYQRKHNVHTYVYINKMNIFHAFTSK